MLYTLLTHDPIDTGDLSRRVDADCFGAQVLFIGQVRDNALGHKVLFLEYEAYAPLAEKELSRIASEAHQRWSVSVALVHRLGRLQIGEASVVIAVGAPHRADAFDACRWIIDTVKTRVPIWKKEYFENGAHWIEGAHTVDSSSRSASDLSCENSLDMMRP